MVAAWSSILLVKQQMGMLTLLTLLVRLVLLTSYYESRASKVSCKTHENGGRIIKLTLSASESGSDIFEAQPPSSLR